MNKYDNYFFDPLYYKKSNNIKNIEDEQLLQHYLDNSISNGFICNKYQILNFYPNCSINYDDENINVQYKNNNYSLNKFCELFIYNIPISFFLDKVKIICKKLNDTKLFIILFIGDNVIGTGIIKDLINNLNSKKVTLGVILLEMDDNIINLIKNNFKSYIISVSIDFGSDIPSSNILFNIVKKKIKFKYVLKIHSKSNISWRYLLIQPFITNNLESLIMYMELNNYNMCGSKKCLINLEKDKFCKNLINNLYDENDIKNSSFIGGTIFLCKKKIYENALKKIKPYNRAMFINSFYYKNDIINNSPVHTLERIFGIEACINSKNNILPLEIIKKDINNILLITIHVYKQKNLFNLINFLKKINLNAFNKIIILSSSSIDEFNKNGINEFLNKNISDNKFKKINILSLNIENNFEKMYRYVRRLPKKRNYYLNINFKKKINLKKIMRILNMFYLSFHRFYDFLYYEDINIILFSNEIKDIICNCIKENKKDLLDSIIISLTENNKKLKKI